MADKRDILKNPDSGFFHDLILRIKLIMRLLGDKRVNFFLKILPIGALIYLVSPIDILPGAVIPFIGALDDAAVIWLGVTLFVSLCPEEIVQEHLQALQKVVSGTWHDASETGQQENIIDVNARDLSQDDR